MLLEDFVKISNMHLQSFLKFGIPIMILFVLLMSANYEFLLIVSLVCYVNMNLDILPNATSDLF